MPLQYPSFNNSAGAVTGATGVAIWIAGAAAARTAKGIYTLTLDDPKDATECSVLVTARGAVVAFAGVVQTSDSVKTVNMVDAAGAAVDSDFDFVIHQAPNC